MILSDRDILTAVQKGDIRITPFFEKNIGTNSYDLHLSPQLIKYGKEYQGRNYHLDCRGNHHNISTQEIEIPKKGYILEPGKLYLGSTAEYTEHPKYVFKIQGKSSLGRLGLFVHITAGFGDIGFKGHITLELVSVLPIKIYPHMPIGQIEFITPTSEPIVSYDKKKHAKYNNATTIPGISQMHHNFLEDDQV